MPMPQRSKRQMCAVFRNSFRALSFGVREHVAFIFEQLGVGIGEPVERLADRTGSGENRRIRDRRFVIQFAVRNARAPVAYMQLAKLKFPGRVEPGSRIE